LRGGRNFAIVHFGSLVLHATPTGSGFSQLSHSVVSLAMCRIVRQFFGRLRRRSRDERPCQDLILLQVIGFIVFYAPWMTW